MINNHLTRLCLVAVCLVSVALRVSANDTLNDVIPNANLSDILRQAKWDGIIGTWVDAESMGTDVKTTYA